jgi:hypothetical protein
MSYQAVAWVYKHSPFLDAGPFSVHVAMAEVVNGEHGDLFWMSLARLAKKSRTHRATAKRAVDELVALGLMECVEHRPGGATLYRMKMPADALVTYDPKTVDNTSSDPARGAKGTRESRGTPRVVSGEVAHSAKGGRAPRAPIQKTEEPDYEKEMEARRVAAAEAMNPLVPVLDAIKASLHKPLATVTEIREESA